MKSQHTWRSHYYIMRCPDSKVDSPAIDLAVETHPEAHRSISAEHVYIHATVNVSILTMLLVDQSEMYSAKLQTQSLESGNAQHMYKVHKQNPDQSTANESQIYSMTTVFIRDHASSPYRMSNGDEQLRGNQNCFICSQQVEDSPRESNWNLCYHETEEGGGDHQAISTDSF